MYPVNWDNFWIHLSSDKTSPVATNFGLRNRWITFLFLDEGHTLKSKPILN